MFYGGVNTGVPVNATFRPIGRYIAVNFNNADTVNPVGSSKITLAAYPS
jgi:hypothetical protein